MNHESDQPRHGGGEAEDHHEPSSCMGMGITIMVNTSIITTTIGSVEAQCSGSR